MVETQTPEKTLKSTFVDFLVFASGVSLAYADAAWFTLNRDSIKTDQDAKRAAYSYAKKYTGLAPLSKLVLSDSDKEKILQGVLLIGLNDVPPYVAEQSTLGDFIEAINEHSRECELTRCDIEHLAFTGEWKDIELLEVPNLFL